MKWGARVYHVGRGQTGTYLGESDSMPGTVIVDFNGDFCRVSTEQLKEV